MKRNTKGQFVRRARRNPSPGRRPPAAPNPRRRRRRSPAIVRTRTVYRRPPVRRRRSRRNPARSPWMPAILAAVGVTFLEGLIRAYVTNATWRTWLPLGAKVGGAILLAKKSKPAAMVLGGLAVADLAAVLVTKVLPAAGSPAPPVGTQGLAMLPAGLAGARGFPSGMSYPSAASYGAPPRLEANPAAFGLANEWAMGVAPQTQFGVM
jgi:hypothetical protein